MPTITSRPLLQATNLIGAPQAPVAAARETQRPAKSVGAFSSVDSFIASTEIVDNALISAVGSYQDSRLAVELSLGGHESGLNGADIARSMGRSMARRALSSTARNGWQVYQGKLSLAQAGGNVVGDVGTSVVSSGVGAVASHLAVFGLSKTGLPTIAVTVGGSIAGWAANNLTHHLIRKTGVTGAISDKATQVFESLGK